MTCVRRAWLTLDSRSVELHDEAAGYFVTELDLGSPDVRDVVNNRPDANGIDDRTQFFGGRVVSVTIVALEAAGAQIDAVASMFGPYMAPNVRPTLHYVLDRPGTPERTMTVRSSAYSWLVNNDYQRDIQLQWVAADPLAYDTVTKTATATPGASVADGRTYDWTPGRTYPDVTPTPAGAANLTTNGDVPVRPLLVITGPVTAPLVNFQIATSGAQAGRVVFVQAMVIDAGKTVTVDCEQRRAWRDGDPSQDVTSFLNWSGIANNGGWPALIPGVAIRMSMTGSTTTAATKVDAYWKDAYLS
jgi:hypothetical protein